jgi:hypothetical protein
MSTIPTSTVRKKPASPRQPLGWSFDAQRVELTITDCDGKAEVYRVLTLDCPVGRAYELVIVGSARFGEFHHVRFEGATPACSCPGGTYRGICKHIVALSAVVAGGAL